MRLCLAHHGRASNIASALSGGARRTLLTALFALLPASCALADELGDARQWSRLGEPLRLVIPIIADAAGPAALPCYAIASPKQSDGLPHILTAHVAVERQGGAARLVVFTTNPLREPVVRLMLRTSCEGASRVYTLFLDPPGSQRTVRSVGKPGPWLPALVLAPTPAPVARIPATKPPPEPAGIPGPDAALPVSPQASAQRSPPAASSLLPPESAALPGDASTAATPTDPGLAVQSLAAENAALRERLAAVSSELRELHPPPVSAHAPAPPPVIAVAAPDASVTPLFGMVVRWDTGWPVAIALSGLVALVAGGLLWRRRYWLVHEEWPLTGPPSHRLASRTSIGDEPVPFRQSGIQPETVVEHDLVPAAATGPPLRRGGAHDILSDIPLAPLLLQPSADDLGRDLESELQVAERSHSVLERAHPDLVEMLVRSWGTAAARGQLAALLPSGSGESARMSAEAIAELRLLLRIAEDLVPRTRPDPRPLPVAPPAPAY